MRVARLLPAAAAWCCAAAAALPAAPQAALLTATQPALLAASTMLTVGARPPPPGEPLFSPPDDDDQPPSPDEDDDDPDANTTERGMFLGAPCEFTCSPKLHHVFCDPITGHCECEKKFPVKLGPSKGCAKPKSLGEQCFYRQACTYLDPHASCVQVNHNALCQCEPGYHSVSYSKPVRKVFCTEDLALLTADVPTLLGVCSGIALLAGLLCLVLHLYTRGRTPHHAGHYADANLSPPMLFSSEIGIPMAVHGTRPSSRSSQRSYSGRRSSPSPRGPHSAPSSSSRAGSRRPSMTSLQSTTSSVRSYSARRFEREREQKERRQHLQMQMRFAQFAADCDNGINNGDGRGGPTPSPRTPNSTDGLLPSVCEGRELSLSRSPGMHEYGSSSMDGILGPCSSSGTSY